MTQAINRIDKQSKPIKITSIAEIKGKDKGREMQTQGQHNDVLSKRKLKPSA